MLGPRTLQTLTCDVCGLSVNSEKQQQDADDALFGVSRLRHLLCLRVPVVKRQELLTPFRH